MERLYRSIEALHEESSSRHEEYHQRHDKIPILPEEMVVCRRQHATQRGRGCDVSSELSACQPATTNEQYNQKDNHPRKKFGFKASHSTELQELRMVEQTAYSTTTS